VAIAAFSLAHCVPHVDDRRVVSGIVCAIRKWLQSKDGPKPYGPHGPGSCDSWPFVTHPSAATEHSALSNTIYGLAASTWLGTTSPTPQPSRTAPPPSSAPTNPSARRAIGQTSCSPVSVRPSWPRTCLRAPQPASPCCSLTPTPPWPRSLRRPMPRTPHPTDANPHRPTASAHQPILPPNAASAAQAVPLPPSFLLGRELAPARVQPHFALPFPPPWPAL
jgi:hypothetical protein